MMLRLIPAPVHKSRFHMWLGSFSLVVTLLWLVGCTSSITVGPAFQPLPSLALAPMPAIELDEQGFSFCYRDEPCEYLNTLDTRYRALVKEFFPSTGAINPFTTMRVRLVTEMRLVNDYQGRLLSYGVLFGPLTLVTPVPFPMALDFYTTSTVMDEEGRPLRTYRSRQLITYWTYSAWGLQDPQLTEAAMRHHLRSLTRSLQFDAAIYRPIPPPSEEPEAAPDAPPVGRSPAIAEPSG